VRCSRERCEPCGARGQSCCPGSTCLAADTICSSDDGNLGECRSCGGPGEPCCAGRCQGDSCCVANAGGGDRCVAARSACGACAGGHCGCGANGAPCCPAGVRGTAACATGDLACVILGGVTPAVCTPCGAPGQPCCARNGCQGGCCTRSQAADPGTCVADGA